jgi:hypothetical protein
MEMKKKKQIDCHQFTYKINKIVLQTLFYFFGYKITLKNLQKYKQTVEREGTDFKTNE